jgi:hypothetical protein
MDVNTDDSMLLSDDSGWSSSDDSDIEELLQDDVEMMGLLLDVQEFEDRAKLLDQRRGSKMGRVTIYWNRALGHEQLIIMCLRVLFGVVIITRMIIVCFKPLLI